MLHKIGQSAELNYPILSQASPPKYYHLIPEPPSNTIHFPWKSLVWYFSFFHMETMPLPSLPLVIDPFSSVLVFPRQDTGLLQPKPLEGIAWAVVPAPEWLLCGKSLSSQHSKQSHLKGLGIALCPWRGHAKQQAWAASTILGNYSPWCPKTLRSLEPPFKAGAQPGLCHCQITEWQQTINYSCKPA